MGSRRLQVANRRTHRFSDTSDNSDRLSKLQHLFIGSPNKSLARSKVTAAAEVLVCGPAIAQFANPSRHCSTNRMQRSTVGFPRRNIRFWNSGLPRLSREQISPSMGSGSVGRLRPSVFMAPDCQWDRALVGTPEILVQMVMIGGSEEFLCRQFSKARADCCKSLEALPVPVA